MVTLRPMNDEEYTAYLEGAIRTYADEKVKAGNWTPEEALERSRDEFLHLLPQGVATPDNYIMAVIGECGADVGMIWLSVSSRGGRREGFIYDFSIHEPYRRRGYGTQAMLAIEEKARALGLESISLHVFGHNRAARALYQKLGYIETNVVMSKQIDSGA